MHYYLSNYSTKSDKGTTTPPKLVIEACSAVAESLPKHVLTENFVVVADMHRSRVYRGRRRNWRLAMLRGINGDIIHNFQISRFSI